MAIVLMAGWVMGGGTQDVLGQVQSDPSGATAFEIIEFGSDARVEAWPESVAAPMAHARWEAQLVTWYHEQGFFDARVDSFDVDEARVWTSPGELTVIADITLVLETNESKTEYEPPSRVHPDVLPAVDYLTGLPASRLNLDQLVDRVLRAYSNAGYLATTVAISSAAVDSAGLLLELTIDPGLITKLEAIRLDGDSRTRESTVMSLLGLRPGQTLEGLDLGDMRTRLSGAGWHEQVFEPRFELATDSTAHLAIPVVPMSPGQFDLVVGALPEAGGSGSQVIGSGHLMLTNAFGKGRMLDAHIHRLPGQTASARLAVETPAPAGWPFRIHAGLEGFQQDSTWNRTRFDGEVRYRLDASTWLGATVARERTRPGFAGSEIVGGSQVIPRSTARFAGLTMRVLRLDHPTVPHRGLALRSTVERGTHSSAGREVQGQDTLSVSRSERRERFDLDLDVYLKRGERLGWAFGLDVSAIRAGRPDMSELLFLGGASSLRGYDENRFQGTTVARGFLETRWYVDRSSWGFLFLDAGWVAVDADFEDALPAILERSEGVHPGYGFGFVFDSAIGPLSLSYALNPDETWSRGRIHAGLSFGL